MAPSISDLRNRVRTLEIIVADFHWMARRYCDGRNSYEPDRFNDHIKTLVALGVTLNPTADGTIWAKREDL